MARVRIVGKRRGPERCVICHGALADSRTVCPSCGATTHADCREAHGRCPTIGCSATAAKAAAPDVRGVPARPRRTPPLWARVGPYSRLIASAAFAAISVATAAGFLLWPILSFASFWASMRHDSDSGTDSSLRGAFIALVLVAIAAGGGFFSLRWLLRIPAVFREVRQLLNETTPVPMQVSINVVGSGSDERRYAILTGGGYSLELPLSGLLPPWWLKLLPPGTGCRVYGLPPPGPYLIELPDGRLALVHPD